MQQHINNPYYQHNFRPSHPKAKNSTSRNKSSIGQQQQNRLERSKSKKTKTKNNSKKMPPQISKSFNVIGEEQFELPRVSKQGKNIYTDQMPRLLHEEVNLLDEVPPVNAKSSKVRNSRVGKYTADASLNMMTHSPSNSTLQQQQKEMDSFNIDFNSNFNNHSSSNSKGVVDYKNMETQQIAQEHSRLLEEFSRLSQKIKLKQDHFKWQWQDSRLCLSKISKKGLKQLTHQEIIKQNKMIEDEIHHNQFVVLNRLRQEYEQIDRRSGANIGLSRSVNGSGVKGIDTSRANLSIDDKTIEVKEKILSMKNKIKLLKKKTKEKGNDIVNGDQIHQEVGKLQRQQKAYMVKQAKLQGQIRETSYKIQQFQIRLNNIQSAYNQAQDYLKLFRLEEEQNQQNHQLQKQYRQKQHTKQILQKKMESLQQTNLQKYHALLKSFEVMQQAQAILDKKMIDSDVSLLKNQNVILDLETQQQEMQEQLTRMQAEEELKAKQEMLRNALRKEEERSGSALRAGALSVNSFITSKYTDDVGSILQENESDVNQTIENEPSPNAQQSKQKLMFTKLQRQHYYQSQKKNLNNKNTPQNPPRQNNKSPLGVYSHLSNKNKTQDKDKDANKKYFLSSSKQIANARANKKAQSITKKTHANTTQTLRKLPKIQQQQHNSTIVGTINHKASSEGKFEVGARKSTSKSSYLKVMNIAAGGAGGGAAGAAGRGENQKSQSNGGSVTDTHKENIEKGKQLIRNRRPSTGENSKETNSQQLVKEQIKHIKHVQEKDSPSSSQPSQQQQTIQQEEIDKSLQQKNANIQQINPNVEQPIIEQNVQIKNNNNKMMKDSKLQDQTRQEEEQVVVVKVQQQVKNHVDKQQKEGRNKQSHNVVDVVDVVVKNTTSQQSSQPSSTQQRITSQRLIGKIVSSSKRQKSKKQQEILQKIDKNNQEYSRKINQLKEQLKNRQSIDEMNNQQKQQQKEKEKVQMQMQMQVKKLVIQQEIKQQQQQQQVNNLNKEEDLLGLITTIKHTPKSDDKNKDSTVLSNQQQNDDLDIESSIGEDIGQINKMIKEKLKMQQNNKTEQSQV